MKLSELPRNKKAKITKINFSGDILFRLNSLGIRAGETVEILHFSILNSSVLLRVGIARIAIRKELLTNIEANYV